MDNKTYLICQAYNWNHIRNKFPITDWCQYYMNILYGDSERDIRASIKLEPVFWKRLYNKYGVEAMQILKDNLDYCEIRMEIQKNKTKVINERIYAHETRCAFSSLL